MTPRLSSSDDIIHAIRAGQADVIDTLYERYRSPFFRWAGKRFDASRHDLEDAWQEAIVAFYEQVSSGKLTTLHYDSRTWLFAVGYRRLLNNRRKVKRILWRDSIDEALRKEQFPPQITGEHSGSEQKDTLLAAMKHMTPQCREILVQRYYQEKSLEEIQQDWEHSSLNTTSATLSRCLKRLKELIKNTRIATP